VALGQRASPRGHITDIDDLVQRFQSQPAAGKSHHTIVVRTRDPAPFTEWFEVTNGKTLSVEGITPVGLRWYRFHPLTVQECKLATVNRKLASLFAFCQWPRGEGAIPANPVEVMSS